MSSIDGTPASPLSVPGRHYTYGYDGAGNRVSYGVNTATTNLWGQQTNDQEWWIPGIGWFPGSSQIAFTP